jgi:hypothetical protein
MDIEDERMHHWQQSERLQHITPDEVPAAVRSMGWADGVAQVLANKSAEDAQFILRIDADIYTALVDYMKPRWPELAEV